MKQTYTLPTGLELQLKPLPNLLRLKLARRSQVSLDKSGKDRQDQQITILADVVEAGVNLTLTKEQKLEAQIYRDEFEREKPDVITRNSDKFVYILSSMGDTGNWGDLVNAIIALGPATVFKDPLVFFKRSERSRK